MLKVGTKYNHWIIIAYGHDASWKLFNFLLKIHLLFHFLLHAYPTPHFASSIGLIVIHDRFI